MSVKKLDDFSPLPGLLPAGRFVLTGVRTETAYAKAISEELSYLADEVEVNEPSKPVGRPDMVLSRH